MVFIQKTMHSALYELAMHLIEILAKLKLLSVSTDFKK